MSAYTVIEGQFDFNRAPLATPSIKIAMHENPGQHKIWEPHGVDGLYFGPD